MSKKQSLQDMKEEGLEKTGEAVQAESLPEGADSSLDSIPGAPDFKIATILHNCFQYFRTWMEAKIPDQGYANPRGIIAGIAWPDLCCEGRVVLTQMEPGKCKICIQAGAKRLDSDRFYSNFMISGSQQEVMDWLCDKNIPATKESILNMVAEAQHDQN